jgi:hypothetical protein
MGLPKRTGGRGDLASDNAGVKENPDSAAELRKKGKSYQASGGQYAWPLPKNYNSASQQMIQRKKLITLLFLTIAVIGFTNKTNAQGWTFTFTLTHSGPCGSNLPQIPTFTIPNGAFPTQADCEALRQKILAVKLSTPVTDNRGNYIGDCSVYYTCTPCAGSDIQSSSTSPGSVSVDGSLTGIPHLLPHESKTVELLIDDLVQKLKSMGMTINKDSLLAAMRMSIPRTGDPDFDKKYADRVMRFESHNASNFSRSHLATHASAFSGSHPTIQSTPIFPGKSSMGDHYTVEASVSPIITTEIEPGKLAPNKYIWTQDWQDKEEKNHPKLEALRQGVGAIAELPPGWVGYGLVAGVILIFKDAEAFDDWYNDNKSISSEQIAVNTFKQIQYDAANAAITYGKKGILKGVTSLGKDEIFNYKNIAKVTDKALTVKDLGGIMMTADGDVVEPEIPPKIMTYDEVKKNIIYTNDYKFDNININDMQQYYRK